MRAIPYGSLLTVYGYGQVGWIQQQPQKKKSPFILYFEYTTTFVLNTVVAK